MPDVPWSSTTSQNNCPTPNGAMPDMPPSSATFQTKFEPPLPPASKSIPTCPVFSFRGGVASGGVIPPLPPRAWSTSNQQPSRRQDPPGADPPSATAATKLEGEEEQREMNEKINKAEVEFKKHVAEFQDLSSTDANNSAENQPSQEDPRDNQPTSTDAAANEAENIEENPKQSSDAKASSTTPTNLSTEGESKKENNSTSDDPAFTIGSATNTEAVEEEQFKQSRAGKRAADVLDQRRSCGGSTSRRSEIVQRIGRSAQNIRFTQNREINMGRNMGHGAATNISELKGDKFFQTTRAGARMNDGHDKYNPIDFSGKEFRDKQVVKDRKGKRLSLVDKLRGRDQKTVQE